MSNTIEAKEQRLARAVERRARDAAMLVARVSDGKGPWRDYCIYVPTDLGVATVELAHIDLPGRIRLTKHQAEHLGAALIEAAKRARD